MTNENLRSDRHDKWIAHNIDNSVLKLRRRRAPHRWVMGGIFEPSWFWTDPVPPSSGSSRPSFARPDTFTMFIYLLPCYISWCSGWYVETIIGRQSEGSIIRGFVNQKWVPYSQRYLFNAIPDTNHNANPTNPNRYSKGNPNPTNPTNPNTRYRIIKPSDYWTLGLSIHYRWNYCYDAYLTSWPLHDLTSIWFTSRDLLNWHTL